MRLLTDTSDSSNSALYEVKAASTRNMVRVAIGQLFDYRTFVDNLAHRCVVLPDRPAPDLVHALGSALVV